MHEFGYGWHMAKKNYGITALDIAKRLLDKGFHSPTIYFPLIIPEAMMVEPTRKQNPRKVWMPSPHQEKLPQSAKTIRNLLKMHL